MSLGAQVMKGDKEIVGTLKGFDDYVNMVLEDVTELCAAPLSTVSLALARSLPLPEPVPLPLSRSPAGACCVVSPSP